MVGIFADDLAGLLHPIESFHIDPANARTGHALDRIGASLATYGQRKPIVVNMGEGGKIEAGNGTWQAAMGLGWTHIAAVRVTDDPMTAVAFGIADNRTGDLSGWDAEVLATLIGSIDPDLDLPTGFEEGELDALIAELGGRVEVLGFDDAFGALPDEDRAPFQQMTFTLHDTQVEQIKEAMSVAKSMGEFTDSENENSNGNALARICETYITDYGNG